MRKLTTREKVLLAVVLIGGVGYLWYASEKAVTSTTEQFAIGGDGTRLADTAPVVPMGLLTQAMEAYDRQGRDLFVYSKRPPTQAELDAERRAREEALARQARDEELRRQNQAAAAAAQANRVPQTPPEPPARQPPRIPYQYIGYLGPKDDRIAVFQEGEELLLARRGELVQEMFKVVEIRYESVVMGYTDPEFESRTRELPMTSR